MTDSPRLGRLSMALGLLSPLLLLASFNEHLLSGLIREECRMEGLLPCVRGDAVAAQANALGFVGLLCGTLAIAVAVTGWRRRRGPESERSA